jgi:uncharacterized membrane protein YeaQ/YmgE (transglycosylase-associated protein family)
MNLQKQRLCFFLALGASGNLAFTPAPPSKNPTHADMIATTAGFNKHDFDISEILAQTEAALQLAAEAMPRCMTTGKDLTNIAQLQADIKEESADVRTLVKSTQRQDEMVAAAVGSAALGVVVGSPLVIGAALGYAGSKLLEGESGKQTKEILGMVGKTVSTQLQGAYHFAHEQLENEKDLSKVSEKVLKALQAKADNLSHEIQESPQQMARAFKEALESEDLKESPGRAMKAFRGFLNSDEVKSAQARALEAFKQGMQSEEMKALQSRASQALKETVETKK